ncbi:MAG: glycosyltransferase family 4 protein [Desulfovibrio sp.]|jgi:glycosyltransferase involved in cell wall biosynthesis|nr:glycosyltransferase family 4 protein [Desulfovibrio sp.]
MNVVFLSSASNTSGGARQALYLAQGLEERGHNVLFFVPEEALLPDLAPHWPYWRLLKGGKSHWRRQIETAMPDDFSPFVFHAFHNAAVKLAAWWGLFWRKRAAIVAHRGVLYMPRNPLPYWLPGIDLFLVNSRACAKVLRTIGLPAGRIACVPNSVPDSRIAPSLPPGSIRAELGIGNDALVFLFIGNNHPNKGCELLMRAFSSAFGVSASSRATSGGPHFADRHVPVHLVLVGISPDIWLPCRDALGMEGRIHCIPPTERIADYLAAGSVFVLPSLSESMPNTLLEAVRAGLPSIGANVGAVSDIIEDCGLLFPPGNRQSLADAMLRMAADPGLRARLAACALARGRFYTPQVRLDKVEQLYSGLLRKKALRP